MVAVEAAAPVAAESPIRAEAEAEAKAEVEVEVEVEVDVVVKSEEQAAVAEVEEEEEEREYKSDMRKLEELMSKLNPSAQEFVPSARRAPPAGGLSADAPVFVTATEYYGGAGAGQPQVGGGGGGGRDSSSDGSSNAGGQPQNRRTRNAPFNQGRRRGGGRTRRADREDSVRRTVYVSDIDQQVTEQKLAEVFSNCGQVVDCRICGDPHSVLRFAFIEFADDVGARAALTLGGTMLGFYPVRVLPSKTAILPVNPKFLPRTEDEKEMVSRTVYCTNIDKKVCEFMFLVLLVILIILKDS
ncbi:hypothetical protein GUJ93_ZPchr0006g42259 [Zizania palustris]|uniref:RRM domain-containing protein n=1 Tax=Zizania palustris TaxID=103762 RepID=A0A8J5T6H0_ZIZPA|nr:hypothetical protein GUJ93_ZPchr0006g42259 [Zizania palustris]